MKKFDFKKALPHLVAVFGFIIIGSIYFSPAWEGQRVKQHDVDSHKGMSNEVVDHRAEFDGEEPLWTNSMFGGMPATQISVIYKSNILRHIDKAMKLGLPHPVSYIWLYMIGFYIFLLCMKVDPWLAIVGSIAYGFSTYFFIITGIGHNSKAVAVAYMAPALGGFLLAFRGKQFIGSAIFTLFTALQVGANHPQVTYYFFMLLGCIFVYEVVRLLKEKQALSLAKVSGLLAVGTVLAIVTSLPNIMGTKEYAQYSQRAGSELTPKLSEKDLKAEDGSTISEEEALKKIAAAKVQKDKDYKLQWSFSRKEALVFAIPHAMGADGTLRLDEDFMENDDEAYDNLRVYAKQGHVGTYWGDQTSSAGPVYIGAIVCLLFILGMVFWKNNLKWPIFILTMLAILLSFGKNMMWFNDIFWNKAPLYSSFRAVTIILVMVELTLPVIGFLWLNDVLKEKDWFNQKFAFFGKFKTEISNKVMLMSVSGAFALIIAIMAIAPSSLFNFYTQNEKKMSLNVEYMEKAQMDQAIAQSQNQNFLAQNKITADQYMGYARQQIKESIEKIPLVKTELGNYRASLFSASAWRTFLFIVLGAGLILAYFMYGFDKRALLGGLALLILADLWPIAKNYLGNEEGENSDYAQWQPYAEKQMPNLATPADLAILANEERENPEVAAEIKKAVSEAVSENEEIETRHLQRIKFGKLNRLTNYRVFDYRTIPNRGKKSLASMPESSYFHKSLGGYHSAKLQRFQDLLEGGMIGQPEVLNMLNVKYIQTCVVGNGNGLYQDRTNPNSLNPQTNPTPPGVINETRLGNAWFVPEVKGFENPDAEFEALKTLQPKQMAITDPNYENNKDIVGTYDYNEAAKIAMTEYRANMINYDVVGAEGKGDFYAVFSEIYYPLGWKCEIDGKSVPINRVNYTLRGVKVPAGAQKIKLYYDLESFKTTSSYALASSTGVLIFVLLMAFLGYRNSNSCNEQE